MGNISTSIGYTPGYGPILGIAGTAREAAQVKGAQQVFYVDSGHANASDGNYGLDPAAPLATIQELMDRASGASSISNPALTEHDVIYVSGNVTETVIVPVTAPQGVTIAGAGNGAYVPSWLPGASAETNLTLRAENWRVTGFNFNFTGNSTAIHLDWDATNNSSGAIIDNNHFFGGWSGLYGIVAHGAPYNVQVLNNEFTEIRSAGGAGTAFAIYTIVTPIAEPLEWKIANNTFMENENHIGSLNNLYGFNASIIRNNVFGTGHTIAATTFLDLRSGHGGQNAVVGNLFQGDYSNAGGYYDSTDATSSWVGNMAEDVGEAEVGDNGWTIAPPAA